MKKGFCILNMFIFIILFGCEDTSNTPTKSIQITSLIPVSGKIGDTITINGINFSNSQDTNFVEINKTKITDYIIWSDTQIKFILPDGVNTGKVNISVNGMKSNEVDFTVLKTGPGNFIAITIGYQTWMLKNLNVSLYNNGDTIPQVTDPVEWKNLKTGAWCYYKNDKSFDSIYGKLYNWYAINDPRGLAPKGWKIPSNDDWVELINFLGKDSIAGGKLKLSGKEYWKNPNLDASNESGFSALPGGWRDPYDGNFDRSSLNGYWWSSSEDNNSDAWKLSLSYDASSLGWYYYSKNAGFSVRCILK